MVNNSKYLKKTLGAAICSVVLLNAGIVSSAQSEQPLFVSGSETVVSDVETGLTSNELLLGYFENKLYGADTSDAAIFALGNSTSFTGEKKVIYDALKDLSKDIADGDVSSAKTPGEDYSYSIKFYYTYEELGISNGCTEEEFNTAVEAKIETYDIETIIGCLMRDCPYEFYWYDDTYKYSYSTTANDSVAITYNVSFEVSPFYRGVDEYTVDTDKTNAVSVAVTNAQIIRGEATSEYYGIPYARLKMYKEKICELVSYDKEAAAKVGSASIDDTNPWGIIYVFDGDENTNVVCEGYAKALQYLCDLDGEIECYCVSGTMSVDGKAGEPHMWNIVTLDGKNYLVDVTNCDDETIGAPDALFLAGAAEADGVYSKEIGGSTVTYTYDENMSAYFGDSILKISENDYSVEENSTLKWTFDEATGTLTISGSGEITNVNNTWKEKHKNAIKNVVIEDGITSIGMKAFFGENNPNLESVKIASTVTNIGEEAFKKSTNLKEINIPASVEVLGGAAFLRCKNLESVTFAEGSKLTYISGDAFQDTKISSITIPDSVTDIGSMAFMGTKISSITIPGSVTSIAEDAFKACGSLETINVVCSWDKGSDYFSYYNPSAKIKRVIHKYEFGSLDNDVYGYICTICKKAGCCGDFRNEGEEESVIWEFDADTGTFTVSGKGKMQDYNVYAIWEGYKPNIKKLVIGEGVTSIGGHAFDACPKLETIEFEGECCVSIIGFAAFSGCVKIKNITIPASVETIDEFAFQSCTEFKSITIPKKVKTIDENAFEYCWNLESITFEEGSVIESIGSEAFKGCDSLKTVNAPCSWKEKPLYDFGDGVEVIISDHKFTVPATCGAKVKCEFCGAENDDSELNAENHEADESEWHSDETNHWRECACGEKVFDTTAHSGGTATCTAKAECEVCGEGYGDVDSTNHANKATKLSSDETGHWYKCVDCDEKLDFAIHTSNGGVVTKEATETTEGVKTYSCTVCKYVIKEEVIPATGSNTSDTTPAVTTAPTSSDTPASSETTTPAASSSTTEAPAVTTTTYYYPIYTGSFVTTAITAPITTAGTTTTTKPADTTKPTDTTKPADTTKAPQIKGNDGKTGWEAIEEELLSAPDGDKIVVEMNGETEVPKDIFAAIEGMDIELVIELDNGFSWTINGEDVTEPMNIDLGIGDEENIPVEIINKVTGEREYKTFAINHDGDFGFTATLTVDMGNENEGYYANLYWYTNGGMEFICADKISAKGIAELKFTHASEYVIVIDEENHGKRAEVSEDADEDVSEDEKDTSDSEVDGDTIITDEDDDMNPATGVIISFAGVVISAAAVLFAKKRNK